MSDDTQTAPIMDGSDDATDEQKRAGLVEQVDNDHEGETAGAKAERLRERLDETGVDPGA